MNLAVTAIGRDRPGIVAANHQRPARSWGNGTTSQMSILHGHFRRDADRLGSCGCSLESLRRGLAEVGREFDLGGITVSPVEADRGAGPTHVLTVHGADRRRPGIVHDTAATLASLASTSPTCNPAHGRSRFAPSTMR